jgi:Lon protease-like protein
MPAEAPVNRILLPSIRMPAKRRGRHSAPRQSAIILGMSEGLLPIFPLELVLLPHAELPLHIFEERYKEMIGECLRLETEFGVVQAKGKGILRTGCTAIITKVVERYDDGRLDILTVGRRRFHILEVNTSREYLRAEVEFFGDTDSGPGEPSTARRALAAFLEYNRAAGSEAEPPSLQDPDLSFRLAQASPDLDFRQFILDLTSEQERLARTAQHLEQMTLRKRVENAMRGRARSNGHGRHLGPLTG